jgi:type II secretory pathway component PulF
MTKLYRVMACNASGQWTELSVPANSDDEATQKLRAKAVKWDEAWNIKEPCDFIDDFEMID